MLSLSYSSYQNVAEPGIKARRRVGLESHHTESVSLHGQIYPQEEEIFKSSMQGKELILGRGKHAGGW